MKKTVVVLLLVLACCVSIIVPACACDCERERPCVVYGKCAVVVGLEANSDAVIVEDISGNIWAFYGIGNWQLGDCVILLMDSRGTESIYDDAILTAHYGGWTLNS